MAAFEHPAIDDIDYGPGEPASAAAVRQRRWRRLNPERYRLRERVGKNRQRARRRGLTEHFTIEEWLALLQLFNYCCLACGRDDVDLEVDHIIPLDRRGNNTIDNVQPLCAPCNKAKGTKIIDYRPHAKGAAA